MPTLQRETTPRSQSKKEDIYYTIASCRFGSVLVAATGRGVCALLLGDDPKELMEDLGKRFPQAGISKAEDKLKYHLNAITRVLDDPKQLSATKLILDIQGTDFQQRVWRELRKIPCGETISYAELARRIGTPNAIRAVATACASNSLAVIVPCHRVIGGDGSLTGYRWGLERKRTLLSMERQNG